MKKIDLHLHTQKCKKGDGASRVIDAEKFIEKIQENNVGLCAITNHNKFDINEYNAVSSKPINFIIFPGIELDVRFDENKIRHIILVCSPECAIDFKDIFSKDDNRNYDDYKLEYNDLILNIKKFNTDKILIIPHFLDKDKDRSISIEEKNLLKKDLVGYTVILEPKLKTMGIINAHNEISLIGSDVKDWGKYSEDAKRLPEMKFAIDSFGKFYELATSSNVFIKSVLNHCEKMEIDLDYNNKLDIYQDVNVIFGGKGSGKTVLMKNHIFPKLSENGKKIFIHEGKDYQKVYDEILKNNEDEVEIDSVLKDCIINDLDSVLNYKASTYNNFIGKYLKYYENQNVSKNAKKIRKTECLYNKNISQTIQDVSTKHRENINYINKVNNINTEYRNDENEHKENLSDELYNLKQEIYEDTIEKAKAIFSVSKTGIIIENIKEIIDKKTGKKSKPNNIGFSKMVSERRAIFEKIKNINESLENIKSSKKIKIGELPDKGQIYSKVEVKVMDKNEKYVKGSPFDRNKISVNRGVIEKIANFSVKDLLEMNKLFSIDELQKCGAEYFSDCVKKSCMVIREDDTIYEPSEGEKSILSISGLIENLAFDCYLFDEIERGLGNKYISEYIIPKLKYLRDIGKTVVLSTHNANIAINTLPTQTIYCNYVGDSEAEIYFAGNMYANELVSIKNTDNIISWEDEAIKHLEGSEHMFNIRRNIWNQ